MSSGRVGWRRGAGWQRGVAVTGPSSGRRRCLNPCPSPFPTSSSIIPDGEISPVRLEAKTYPRRACPSRSRFKRWRAYAGRVTVCSTPRLVWLALRFPDTEFRTGLPLQTVSAQGSFAPEALPSFLANTSPCANPGASRLHFVPGTYSRRPCRLHHPRLVSGTVPLWTAFLSWSAAPPIPAVRRVHITSSSPTTSAFALLCGARLPHVSHQTASRGRKFSIRQAFLYVAALQFACPPNRSAPLPGA